MGVPTARFARNLAVIVFARKCGFTRGFQQLVKHTDCKVCRVWSHRAQARFHGA